jgi:hypothetical protein
VSSAFVAAISAVSTSPSTMQYPTRSISAQTASTVASAADNRAIDGWLDVAILAVVLSVSDLSGFYKFGRRERWLRPARSAGSEKESKRQLCSARLFYPAAINPSVGDSYFVICRIIQRSSTRMRAVCNRVNWRCSAIFKTVAFSHHETARHMAPCSSLKIIRTNEAYNDITKVTDIFNDQRGESAKGTTTLERHAFPSH